jgi:hypothetical protein
LIFCLKNGTTNNPASMTISGTKFVCGENGHATAIGHILDGTIFENLLVGAVTLPSGFSLNSCVFTNCASGSTHAASACGVSYKDCTFTNCTNGINSTVGHGNCIQITNCDFVSCTYGINIGQYAGDIYVEECEFTTPTTMAINRHADSGCTFCSGCTIDGGSIAKAYNVTASGAVAKQYVFVGSFGKNGTIYGNGSVIQDFTNHRTTAPCLAIAWVATSTRSNLDIKIVSAYVNSGEERTYSLYLKASNASWSGTVTPKWKLNGKTIKTESNITSLTTSYVQYSYTCASGLITEDGELSLEFQPNMNNYAIYVDDFEVS